MKILVFCSDLLPLDGLPTSGGGLRSWQLIESLRRLGHEVVASMPLFTYLGRRFAHRIQADGRADAWQLGNQDALIDRHRPDAVLFSSSWITDRLARDHDCLMLYDLHGPQLLEQQYKRERNLVVNAQVKVEKLAKADFVTCAGHRQRYYFLPFLLLAGFDVESLDRYAVVPIACPPELPVHEFPPRVEIVLGGGFFPWQDPTAGLSALRDVLGHAARADVRVRIFGRSHGITGSDDEAYAAIAANLSRTPGVEFHDFLPHRELIEIYRTSSFALDLHATNPERELAFPTRTVEYLWTGLPVLTSEHGELAGWVRQYDAGWTVDPARPADVRATLADLLSRPEQLAGKSRGAQALVRDRLTYLPAVRPLADFLRAPSPRRKGPAAKILPLREYWRLLSNDGQYQELLKSRALRAATTVAAWRRRWLRCGTPANRR